jgi:hypothetical protein
MKFPDYQLPLMGPWLAQDEAVWLRLSAPDGAPARWIVLDPDGRPRGEMELPGNSRPLWSKGDVLWSIVPDELDIQGLVRYAVGRT